MDALLKVLDNLNILAVTPKLAQKVSISEIFLDQFESKKKNSSGHQLFLNRRPPNKIFDTNITEKELHYRCCYLKKILTHATLLKNDPTKIVFQVLKGFNVLKNDTNAPLALWVRFFIFSNWRVLVIKKHHISYFKNR